MPEIQGKKRAAWAWALRAFLVVQVFLGRSGEWRWSTLNRFWGGEGYELRPRKAALYIGAVFSLAVLLQKTRISSISGHFAPWATPHGCAHMRCRHSVIYMIYKLGRAPRCEIPMYNWNSPLILGYIPGLETTSYKVYNAASAKRMREPLSKRRPNSPSLVVNVQIFSYTPSIASHTFLGQYVIFLCKKAINAQISCVSCKFCNPTWLG